MNIRPSTHRSVLAPVSCLRRSWFAPALPVAWACAAAVGSMAAHAGPPDWSKATAAPAATLVQPTAPAGPTAPAMGSAASKAGSAFASKTVVAPATAAAMTPAVVAPAVPSTSALTPKTSASPNATAAGAKDLFKLDDRAIVVMGGKPVAAGDLKAKLKADIATKAGPPKLVKATPRKLDLGSLNVMSGTAPNAPTKPIGDGLVAANTFGAKTGVTTVATGKAATVGQPYLKTALANGGAAQAYASTQCLDNGPPKIEEVAGKLKVGSLVTIWGTCFGDKPGRVEVIGQFPGGKLMPTFSAWDKTRITIEVPATIRGASDHTVAVSVVTSDGKTSIAMQAQFIAARERVEVPDQMWAGGGGYELAATVETLNTANNHTAVNPAAGGRLPKTVRINPQCSLDNMDVTTLAGSVTSINGFEVGPPNAASITMDWVGTCVDTKTTTHYNYVIAQVGDDISISSACRVALQARTWAYCPAGIAP